MVRSRHYLHNKTKVRQHVCIPNDDTSFSQNEKQISHSFDESDPWRQADSYRRNGVTWLSLHALNLSDYLEGQHFPADILCEITVVRDVDDSPAIVIKSVFQLFNAG